MFQIFPPYKGLAFQLFLLGPLVRATWKEVTMFPAALHRKELSNTTWFSLTEAQRAGLCLLPAPGLGPASASVPWG